jgi:hypothetical protein
VRGFLIATQMNGETSEDYIINIFNYTLKEMASGWCHNYMLEFPDYMFSELIQIVHKCH